MRTSQGKELLAHALWKNFACSCLTARGNICLGDIGLPADDEPRPKAPAGPAPISQVILADYIFVGFIFLPGNRRAGRCLLIFNRVGLQNRYLLPSLTHDSP